MRMGEYRRRFGIWLVVAAIGLSGGCGGGGAPSGPSLAIDSLAGTWSGAVQDSYGGQGVLRLSIQQADFALSGTFQFEFDQRPRNRSGTLSGNTAVPPLLAPRMQLSSSEGFECAPGVPVQSFVQITWTRSGDTLTGTYVGFGCVGGITGTFEVLRQR
jgi:hypothetical protein